MNDELFAETLARGTAGEDRAYTWLRMNYSFVQDMRYQKHEKGSGPRLEGTSGNVILPDFSVVDPYKGSWAIDVKTKSSIYAVNGVECFTVDDYKFRDYVRYAELYRHDGLLLLFIYKDEFYLYNSKDTIGVTSFNNGYGRNAYLFKHDRTKIKK